MLGSRVAPGAEHGAARDRCAKAGFGGGAFELDLAQPRARERTERGENFERARLSAFEALSDRGPRLAGARECAALEGAQQPLARLGFGACVRFGV